MDLWVKGMGVSEEERITLGKRLSGQIAAEDVYIIGIIGPGAASGVRVAKVNMGNLPARMYISPDGKAESISVPVTLTSEEVDKAHGCSGTSSAYRSPLITYPYLMTYC